MAVNVRGHVADESSAGVELAGSQDRSWQPQLLAACRVCSILVFVLASRPPTPLSGSLPFSLPPPQTRSRKRLTGYYGYREAAHSRDIIRIRSRFFNLAGQYTAATVHYTPV